VLWVTIGSECLVIIEDKYGYRFGILRAAIRDCGPDPDVPDLRESVGEVGVGRDVDGIEGSEGIGGNVGRNVPLRCGIEGGNGANLSAIEALGGVRGNLNLEPIEGIPGGNARGTLEDIGGKPGGTLESGDDRWSVVNLLVSFGGVRSGRRLGEGGGVLKIGGDEEVVSPDPLAVAPGKSDWDLNLTQSSSGCDRSASSPLLLRLSLGLKISNSRLLLDPGDTSSETDCNSGEDGSRLAGDRCIESGDGGRRAGDGLPLKGEDGGDSSVIAANSVALNGRDRVVRPDAVDRLRSDCPGRGGLDRGVWADLASSAALNWRYRSCCA
jgi:hypothetical protein